MKKRLATGVCAVAVLLASASSVGAATIILNDVGGVTGSPAEAGFKTAANFWGSLIANPVTIRLDVGFDHLGPNILGQTGSTFGTALIQDVEHQLQVTGTSSLDALAAANLPALGPSQYSGFGIDGIKMFTPGYTDPVAKTGIDNSQTILDNDGSVNNVLMGMTQANAKALGMFADDGSADGSITFSSDFSFDFNPTNSVPAGSIDFLTVAIHEIGHALGFVSGVDDYDVLGAPNGEFKDFNCGTEADPLLCQNYPVNDTWWAETLDLFRYADASGIPNLVPGTEGYFSVDGGATDLGNFSTGTDNGDGWQASHWKAPVAPPFCANLLGIMNPYSCNGHTGIVTNLDFEAFDAIGWNFTFDPLASPRSYSTVDAYLQFGIPEPATWGLMIMGFGLAGAAVRRRGPALARI